MKKTGIFLLIIALLAVSNLAFATPGATVGGVSALALASTPTPTPTPTATPTPPLYNPTPTPTAKPTIPSVFRLTTQPATDITATSATLNATIEITDGNPSAYIYYWEASDPSVRYCAVIASFYIGPATTNFSGHTRTDLKPATQYEFVATAPAGQTGGIDGSVMSFTTLDASTPTPSPTPTPLVYSLQLGTDMSGAGSVSASPADIYGNTSGLLYYTAGTTVQLTATCHTSGYYFGGWDGNLTGNKNPETIVMDSNKTVAAFFLEGIGVPTPTPTVTPTPTPTSTPTPTPSGPSGIKIQFFNSNTAANINTLYTNFKLVNVGSTPINLTTVKLRYYFTNDGTQADNFACDYSTVGSGNVTAAFATITKTNADRYLEIGFTSGAGSLAGGASAEVKGRIWKSDWSNFTQTNDYSFNATATNYADWSKVTGYISGVFNWGVEP